MYYKVSKLITLFILFPFIVFSQQKNIESVRVFYIGGQSNMVGFGYIVLALRVIKEIKNYINRIK